LLTDFTEIHILDSKIGKHYFHMLAELNKMVFSAAPHLCHKMNWSTASSTRTSINGAQGWTCVFATRNSTL